MAIEIVSIPIKNGGSFHSYVKLPEGKILYGFQFQILRGMVWNLHLQGGAKNRSKKFWYN